MKACYMCEICQEHYDSGVAASDCEQSHWQIDREKLEEIQPSAYNMDYDSVDSLIVPMKRINNGLIEHHKMRFVIDRFVYDN